MPEETNKTDIIKEEQARTIRKKVEFLKAYPDFLGIITATCQDIRINRSTYYDWIDADDEFKNAVEKLSIQQRGDVEDRLVKAIAKDNIIAIIFYLKSKHPEYKTRIDVKNTFNQKEMDDLANTMKNDLDKRGGKDE